VCHLAPVGMDPGHLQVHSCSALRAVACSKAESRSSGHAENKPCYGKVRADCI